MVIQFQFNGCRRASQAKCEKCLFFANAVCKKTGLHRQPPLQPYPGLLSRGNLLQQQENIGKCEFVIAADIRLGQRGCRLGIQHGAQRQQRIARIDLAVAVRADGDAHVPHDRPASAR